MSQQHSGVFVIVVNKNRDVLLGKRKDSYKAGMYGFPGGRLEINETLAGCAKRELTEETGLNAETFTYIGVIRETQGDHNFIHFAFACDRYSGKLELKEPDKCEGWNYYPLSNLPQPILPGHQAGLAMFMDKKNKDYRDILE